MADTERTIVKFNSREQILSGDVNRLQKLGSRDAQNVLREGALRDSFSIPTLGTQRTPGYIGTPGDSTNPSTPISRGTIGDIVPTVGSNTFTVGAGQADFQVATADPDATDWQIIRWPDTHITTIAPDASQYRIDVIYATPAMVDSDLESRNVLLDPSTRSIAPQNLFKTSDPTATLLVQTGTPGSNVAPAVPAGTLAIWEVVTNAGDADSTAFRYIRRVWRRVESFGTCHGILANCVPQWLNQTGSGADAGAPGAHGAPFLQGGKVHRAIMDGEVICFPQGGHVYAVMDSAGDPTALGAATHDQVCYLYLCGGRWAPQQGLPPHAAPADNVWAPLRLVASTTAPSIEGRAISDLAFGGVTIPNAGTLFVGVAFISSSATGQFKPCVIDGDWIYPQTSASVEGGPPLAQFTQPVITGPLTSGTVSLLTKPSLSTVCDLVAMVDESAAGTPSATLFQCPSGGVGDVAILTVSTGTAALWPRVQVVRGVIPNNDGAMNWSGTLLATSSLFVAATGYNMNVKRLG
jgi:hypothetical protein